MRSVHKKFCMMKGRVSIVISPTGRKGSTPLWANIRVLLATCWGVGKLQFSVLHFTLGLLTIWEECAANSFVSLTRITPYKCVHCILKFCSRKWRFFILNFFFQVALSIRIITTCLGLQDIPLSKEVHYRIHKSTLSVPSHSQTNQVQTLTSYTIQSILLSFNLCLSKQLTQLKNQHRLTDIWQTTQIIMQCQHLFPAKPENW